MLNKYFLFSGADAILMHSKKSDPSDIEAFMKAWNNQVSLACILFMGESARVLSAVAQRSQFNPFAFIP